jgi:hypothetical protein
VRYSVVFVVVVRYLLSRFLLVRYSTYSRKQILISSSTVLALGIRRQIGTELISSCSSTMQGLLVQVVVWLKAYYRVGVAV